jgi:hypothetical protein
MRRNIRWIGVCEEALLIGAREAAPRRCEEASPSRSEADHGRSELDHGRCDGGCASSVRGGQHIVGPSRSAVFTIPASSKNARAGSRIGTGPIDGNCVPSPTTRTRAFGLGRLVAPVRALPLAAAANHGAGRTRLRCGRSRPVARPSRRSHFGPVALIPPIVASPGVATECVDSDSMGVSPLADHHQNHRPTAFRLAPTTAASSTDQEPSRRPATLASTDRRSLARTDHDPLRTDPAKPPRTDHDPSRTDPAKPPRTAHDPSRTDPAKPPRTDHDPSRTDPAKPLAPTRRSPSHRPRAASPAPANCAS